MSFMMRMERRLKRMVFLLMALEWWCTILMVSCYKYPGVGTVGEEWSLYYLPLF
jgi:hypothetical protein